MSDGVVSKNQSVLDEMLGDHDRTKWIDDMLKVYSANGKYCVYSLYGGNKVNWAVYYNPLQAFEFREILEELFKRAASNYEDRKSFDVSSGDLVMKRTYVGPIFYVEEEK